jgi:hypothetical protein
MPTVDRLPARLALIYSDGSLNVLKAGATLKEAEALARRDDENERDPGKMTRVAEVLVTIMINHGRPNLRPDQPASTNEQALLIAVAALEDIGREGFLEPSDHANDALARIRTLLPELG